MLTQPPRKRFGQHFLVDSSVIDAIVRSIDPQRGDAIVEIGPGRGALTEPLRASGARLTVIEIDRDLAAHWRSIDGLEVVEDDVLRVDFSLLATRAGRSLRVVGNLPYNISTPVLFHLLESASQIADQHLMLQKEVVDRIVAMPGGRDYGRLSVMLQWRYDTEWLFDVGAQAFEPPPRVVSAVLRMAPKPALPRVDARLLSELVTVAFSQRRKLLRHTLGRWLQRLDGSSRFDLQRRAEEVSVEEYIALAQEVGQHRAVGEGSDR